MQHFKVDFHTFSMSESCVSLTQTFLCVVRQHCTETCKMFNKNVYDCMLSVIFPTSKYTNSISNIARTILIKMIIN